MWIKDLDYLRRVSEIARSRKSTRVSVDAILRNRQPKSTKAFVANARWIQEEAGLRVVKVLADFHRLPYVVMLNQTMLDIYDHYRKAHEDLDRFSYHTDNNTWSIDVAMDVGEAAKRIIRSQDWAHLLANCSQAREEILSVLDFNQVGSPLYPSKQPTVAASAVLDHFFDRVITSRIGTRLLLNSFAHDVDHPNVLAMAPGETENGDDEGPQSSYALEVIDTSCNAWKIAQRVAGAVMNEHPDGPRIQVSDDQPDFTFPFVPKHLQTILYEILVQCVVRTEAYRASRGDAVKDHPILCEMHQGHEELFIVIQDKSGGTITNSDLTSYDPVENITQSCSPWSSELQMPKAAGGFGLPVARHYIKYFGGGLQLEHLRGVGTTFYINLKFLQSQMTEILPEDLATQPKRRSQ